MNFTIGVANRIDDEQVRMREMEVETYDEQGDVEMKVVLPESVLNLKTSIVTSQTKTTISRDDFVITGDSIRFDTTSKVAALVGNVHMTVYDLNDEAGKPKKSNAPKK
jgi:lipopolysaccharide export system protein LptC